jgi:hypothetical protein
MCVIVFKPSGVLFPEESILQQCYEANRDGCGFAYIKNLHKDDKTRLVIRKNMNFRKHMIDIDEEVNRNFIDAAQLTASPWLFHYRIATDGLVNESNCHPFRIDDNHVFAHNGMISNCKPAPKAPESDTRRFNYDILKLLEPDMIWSEATQKLMTKFIGHSKLVFLRSDGEYLIVNEKHGTWKDGLWFSNMRWDVPRSRGQVVNFGYGVDQWSPLEPSTTHNVPSVIGGTYRNWGDPTMYGECIDADVEPGEPDDGDFVDVACEWCDRTGGVKYFYNWGCCLCGECSDYIGAQQ